MNGSSRLQFSHSKEFYKFFRKFSLLCPRHRLCTCFYMSVVLHAGSNSDIEKILAESWNAKLHFSGYGQRVLPWNRKDFTEGSVDAVLFYCHKCPIEAIFGL